MKSRVGSALNRRIEYPLANIDSVSYVGDRIVFHYRVQHAPAFENMNNDDRPVLESFRPADARQFVDSVRVRKNTH